MNQKSSCKNKRKILRDYRKGIILDYIRTARLKDFHFLPLYLKDELKISDPQTEAKKLYKAQYLTKDKDGSIVLTEKGKDFVNDQKEELNFFHFASPYVTLEEFERGRREMLEESNFEYLMISLLEKKLETFRKEEDTDAVQNLCEDIAYLALRIGYSEEALQMYLTMLYYQVSGLEYYPCFLKYIDKKYSLKKIKSCYAGVIVSPRLLDSIAELKDFYFDGMIEEVFKKNKVHINFCTKELFEELTEKILDNQYDPVYWNQKFGESFNQLIKVADGLTA